jgi:hypothetical protein
VIFNRFINPSNRSIYKHYNRRTVTILKIIKE